MLENEGTGLFAHETSVVILEYSESLEYLRRLVSKLVKEAFGGDPCCRIRHDDLCSREPLVDRGPSRPYESLGCHSRREEDGCIRRDARAVDLFAAEDYRLRRL